MSTPTALLAKRLVSATAMALGDSASTHWIPKVTTGSALSLMRVMWPRIWSTRCWGSRTPSGIGRKISEKWLPRSAGRAASNGESDTGYQPVDLVDRRALLLQVAGHRPRDHRQQDVVDRAAVGLAGAADPGQLQPGDPGDLLVHAGLAAPGVRTLRPAARIRVTSATVLTDWLRSDAIAETASMRWPGWVSRSQPCSKAVGPSRATAPGRCSAPVPIPRATSQASDAPRRTASSPAVTPRRRERGRPRAGGPPTRWSRRG